MRTRRLLVLATAASLVALPALAAEVDDPLPDLVPVRGGPVQVEAVATGLVAPNWGVSPPGRPDELWVTDQPGQLVAVDLATGATRTVADVSALLLPGFERGLLGLAFHPDFATDGRLYTYTSQPVDGPADFSTMPDGVAANHQSVITEWQVDDPNGAAPVVDAATAREVLRIDEPQGNHNAGALSFGPDGFLYVSLGDGGNRDDEGVGHSASGNGQDPTNVLGTILRLDPDGSNGVNGQYGVPADNPFVGDDSALDEIWAWGFRNPFRFSFDTATGDLWVGDVGQGDLEEVDIVAAGDNHGWPLKEGTFAFEPNGDEPGFVTDDVVAVPGLVDPVAQYDHDDGIAVLGGFVYRGGDLPQLRGTYVFGDFLSPARGTGRLFTLRPNGRIAELRIRGTNDFTGAQLLGFGQDAAGEVYPLVRGGPTSAGAVLRLEPFRG